MQILRGRPLLQSFFVNALLFIVMLLLFKPHAENPADAAFYGGAWQACMWGLGGAALTELGYLFYSTGQTFAGKILSTGSLLYLSYECYILPNTIKLLVVLISLALFSVGCAYLRRSERKYAYAAAGATVCAVALAVFWVVKRSTGVYSIQSTMPVVEPFRFGELRYHSILSAIKDYLKYEPRIILQVPMLYPVLLFSYLTMVYGGKKGRIAGAVSMLSWIWITFIGRLYSLLGYYWVYTVAFIPALFILLFIIKDIELPDARRAFVHTALLVILPLVILPARFSDAWRFGETKGSDSGAPVYLYEVNPYELKKD